MSVPPRLASQLMPRIGRGGDVKTHSMAISRVALRGFKGHKNLELDMGRITVLIGPTNSGKSAVLQALNMLKSALENDGRIMEGSAGQGLGEFAGMAAGGDENKEVGICVHGRKKIQARKHMVDTKFVYDATFGRLSRPVRLDAVVDMACSSQQGGAGSMRLDHSYGGDADKTVVSGAGTPNGSPVQARADGGCAPRVQAELPQDPAAVAFGHMFCNGSYFASLLDEMWHVPFSRVATTDRVPLEYDAGILSPDRMRAAASLISRISADNSAREKISDMLDCMGLGRIEVRTIPVGKGKKKMLTLDIVKNGSRRTAVREGTGLDQMVAMLAILAYAPSGSVVAIEEPEIHLDPATQARLMKVMVEQAVKENKQIVFTTHSDHLIYPLLAYIEKRDHPLACGDVALYYFDAGESGAVAGAERLAINERGQIRGGLRGFWNVDMRAMDDILG